MPVPDSVVREQTFPTCFARESNDEFRKRSLSVRTANEETASLIGMYTAFPDRCANEWVSFREYEDDEK